jgi:hypothetical protein
MNDITTARMLMTTAVVAAVAAMFAGGANAVLMDAEGGSGGDTTAVAQPGDPGTIPYLSHGIGVDESLFSGQAPAKLDGVHAALQQNHGTTSASQSSGQASLGLTGDSPIGRFPETTQTAVSSGDDDLDWSSFGAGAGVVALVAVGIAGLWLATRKRGGVALP